VHGEVKGDEIVSGYQFDAGRYVIIDPDENEKLRPAREKAINISGFVEERAVDARYYSGKNYFLTPDGPVAQKPYALLLRAMREMGRSALSEVVIGGRKSIALVKPLDKLLQMSLLSYDADLKRLGEFEDEVPSIELDAKELKLAKQLAESLAVNELDLAEYKDDYTAKLTELIEAKVAGKQVIEQPAEQAPMVINLMEALEKSLAQNKAGAAGGRPSKMVAPGTAGKAKEARKRKSS